MRNVVIAAALLSATVASAQPAVTQPMEPYYQQPSYQQPIPEVKSESTATLLAIGTTLGSFAVMASGAEHENSGVLLTGMAMMLIGPSAGHLYAGETAHGVKMSLLRTGAAVVLGAGLLMNTSVACDLSANENGNGGSCESSRDDRETGRKMMWLGGGTLIAATLYDLWDAHNAAHRANVREARRWNIGPAMMTGASGTNVPGLSLGGQF